MKILLALLVLAPFTPAFAHDHDGGDFPANKDKIVAHIDERIAKLQEHKACVTAAADKAAFKACHEKMKEFREEEMKEMKEMRKAKHK